MRAFEYTVTDEAGIHARPAGELVKEAKKYTSRITITQDGRSAVATKLMAVMALGIKCGQTVTVAIEGEDEETAYIRMKEFFERNF